MKKILYMALATAFIGLASCNDDFDGANRFMDNPNQEEGTNTFIVEDYTGQFCVNCPQAAQMLSNLKDSVYGDRMIIVAMHAGGLSLGSPLHNQQAQTYMDALGLKNNPAVSVNRSYNDDGVSTNWLSHIASIATGSTYCDIEQTVDYPSENTVKISAIVRFTNMVRGNFGVQHWLLEDGVVSPQTGHDGINLNYEHNHVFRTCLYEDVWGMPLLGSSNDGIYEADVEYQAQPSLVYEIPNDWVKDNLSIVTFVFRYSDNSSNPIAEIVEATITNI